MRPRPIDQRLLLLLLPRDGGLEEREGPLGGRGGDDDLVGGRRPEPWPRISPSFSCSPAALSRPSILITRIVETGLAASSKARIFSSTSSNR